MSRIKCDIRDREWEIFQNTKEGGKPSLEMQTYSLKFLVTWNLYTLRRTIQPIKGALADERRGKSKNASYCMGWYVSLDEKIALHCLQDPFVRIHRNVALFSGYSSPMTSPMTIQTRETRKVPLCFALTDTYIINEEKSRRESEKFEEDGKRSLSFYVSFVTKRRTTHKIVPLLKRYQFVGNKIRTTPQD